MNATASWHLVLHKNVSGTIRDSGIKYGLLIVVLLVALCSLPGRSTSKPTVAGAPLVGYRTSWEPTPLVRLRYFLNPRKMIQEAFPKVSNLAEEVS